MKFVVDCMLGKLAKWLKILGFDAVFFPRAEDDKLLDIARRQDRVLLTRDTGLLEKAGDVPRLFLESERWPDQVRQVLDHFDIQDQVAPHTRCIDCNLLLKNLPRKNARNLVSSFVFEHADSFAICPGCGRVFWRGTHFRDMERRIDDLLNRGG